MLLMNQVEYAKHRGVSKQAINQLVKAGKLVLDEAGKKIDVAASDRALGEVRDRIIARDEAAPGAQSSGGYTPPAEGGLTKARTATEVYRARLAQLEYDEKVGKLLRADDVARSMRLCADAIARDIELFPTRADELAAAFRQNELPGLRLVLSNMSRQVLATLATNMRLLNAADEAAAVPEPS